MVDSTNSTGNVISGSKGNSSCGKGTVAKTRMEMAAEAIAYTKSIIPNAGNTEKGIRDSSGNSIARTNVARDNCSFYRTSECDDLNAYCDRNKMNLFAFMAAKAELAQGGNCDEHAAVTFEYLREKYPNEQISIVESVPNPPKDEHIFVVIGEPGGDPDKLVAVDAWQTEATPVKLKDHVCYRPELEGNGLVYQASTKYPEEAEKDNYMTKQSILDGTVGEVRNGEIVPPAGNPEDRKLRLKEDDRPKLDESKNSEQISNILDEKNNIDPTTKCYANYWPASASTHADINST